MTRSRPRSLRPTISSTALGATLAVSISAVAAPEAPAQEAPAPAQELSPITVEDDGWPANTLRAPLSLGRLPGSVQDTPQAIQVITPELMRQQGVTTLEQALRNVPGVTVAVGEGNGGMNGDMFRIRGFDAKGDIYVDGLRDFGVYVRDSFNYEAVEVLKGPSSESFGMGTTGGAINTVSKTPQFSDFYAGTAGVGNAETRRLTADVNQVISDKVAVRLNALIHQSHVADRDDIQSDRYGIAPSVKLRLGDATNLSLVYFYQNNHRIPDYGVPVVTRPGKTVGKPITEYGVDQDSWYGKYSDEDQSNVHMLTGRFDHAVNDWLTLYNDTRFAYANRDFSPSPVNCNADCSADFFAGEDAQYGFGGGGGPSYKQDSYGAQNITTGVADFRLGSFRQQAVMGVDLFFQDDERKGFAYTSPKTGGSVYDPDPSDDDYHLTRNPANDKDGDSQNVGLFLSDRFWLTDQVSLLAGVRWDYYKSSYEVGSNDEINSSSNQLNPKASLIWEPTRSQTYYVSYARSSTPQGQFVTSAPNPLNEDASDLDPEENEIFEIGAKVGLLDDRLGLSGSVFRIYKDRVYEEEPDGTIVSSSNTRQRMTGFDLGVTGRITDAWTLGAAYTWLDGEIRGANDEAVVGNDIPNAPRNAFALWTTYDLSSIVPTGPGRLSIGAGATYRDAMYTNDAETQRVPSNLSYDGMVAYEYENWRLALNGYNLTDRLNYDGTQGGRIVPAAGRTVLLTLGASF